MPEPTAAEVLYGRPAAAAPPAPRMNDEQLADRLYPPESRAAHYASVDLDQLHLIEGRDSHQWDERGLRLEAVAANIDPIEFSTLVKATIAGAEAKPTDDAITLSAVETRRQMAKAHGPEWEREFRAADAWFKRVAPRLHRAIGRAGAAGNDREVLNVILHGYWRSRRP